MIAGEAVSCALARRRLFSLIRRCDENGVKSNTATQKQGESGLEMTAYWMIVERLENWEADASDGFRRFGIPERSLKSARRMRKGDLLICYVSSGISAFSDLREIVEDAPKPSRRDDRYDTAFPYHVATAPRLILPRPLWVRVHDIIEDVGFLGGRGDWRQLMRLSIRELSEHDGGVISGRLRRAAEEKVA